MSAGYAAARHLARCPTCERVHRLADLPPGAEARCSRCGDRIQLRRTQSLERTWAFLIAAMVFYVPANLFPVMYVGRLGATQGDTILTGVIAMFSAGWWMVGGLIFVASITVPLAKLVCLTGLLISVHRGSQWSPRERARLYRVVDVIGHWSMLDVFVVSITVALVNLGAIANVRAGAGATWFAAVVVLTMLAAMNFDPRLIWDAAGQPESVKEKT